MVSMANVKVMETGFHEFLLNSIPISDPLQSQPRKLERFHYSFKNLYPISSENRIRKLTLVLDWGNFIELPCWRVSKSFYQFPMSVRRPCLDRSNVVGAGTPDSSVDTNHQTQATVGARSL